MTTFTRVSDSDRLAGDATCITLNELGFFSLTAVRTGAGNLKLTIGARAIRSPGWPIAAIKREPSVGSR